MKLPMCPKCKLLGKDTYTTMNFYLPAKKLAQFQCLPKDPTADHHTFMKRFDPLERKKDDATRSSLKLL